MPSFDLPRNKNGQPLLVSPLNTPTKPSLKGTTEELNVLSILVLIFRFITGFLEYLQSGKEQSLGFSSKGMFGKGLQLINLLIHFLFHILPLL